MSQVMPALLSRNSSQRIFMRLRHHYVASHAIQDEKSARNFTGFIITSLPRAFRHVRQARFWPRRLFPLFSHLIPFPEKSFAKVARAVAAQTSALGNNRGYDCYRLRAFRPHNLCNSQHKNRGCQRANVQDAKHALVQEKKTRTRIIAVPPRGWARHERR